MDFTPTQQDYIEAGDRYLAVHQLTDAWKAYRKSGSLIHLTKIGDEFFKAKQYAAAIRAHEEAKNLDRLKTIGKHCLKVKAYEDAYKAFFAADDQSGFIELGKCQIEEGNLGAARRAYAAINALLSKEQIIRIGDVCFEKERYRFAAEAYGEAQAREKLLRLGSWALKHNKLDLAMTVFLLANSRKGLIRLAEAADVCQKPHLAHKARRAAISIAKKKNS